MITGKINRALRDSGIYEIACIYFLYYSSHSVTQHHISHDKEQLKENVSRLCPCQTESWPFFWQPRAWIPFLGEHQAVADLPADMIHTVFCACMSC